MRKLAEISYTRKFKPNFSARENETSLKTLHIKEPIEPLKLEKRNDLMGIPEIFQRSH